MDTPFFRSTSTTPDWVSIVPKKVNIILTIYDLYHSIAVTNNNYSVDIVKGCLLLNFSVFFKNADSEIWYNLFNGEPEITTASTFSIESWTVNDGPTKTISWDIPETVIQIINPNGVKYKVTGLIPVDDNSLRWHIYGIKNGVPVDTYKNFYYDGSEDSIFNCYFLCNSMSNSEIAKILEETTSLDKYKYSLLEEYSNIRNYDSNNAEFIRTIYYMDYHSPINAFNLGLKVYPSPVDTSIDNRNAWVNIEGQKYPSKCYPYIVNNGNTTDSPALNVLLVLRNPVEEKEKESTIDE